MPDRKPESPRPLSDATLAAPSGDQEVRAGDLADWQANYGAGAAAPANASNLADWQVNYGSRGSAPGAPNGLAAAGDGDVDGRDFLTWPRTADGETPSTLAELKADGGGAPEVVAPLAPGVDLDTELDVDL
jgi:hypothetical protein